ncbi:MAG: sulfotransferase [Vicingaceae bacterium]|nr:sulfotransferase [Vicingaceae bacterium]
MLAEKLDNIPFFFIIGRPRSGTTMLSTILDANKQTAIPIESKVIIYLYFKFKNVKLWNEKLLLKFYDATFQQPKIDTWIINKEQLKNDIMELGENATFQRLIKLIYLNYVSFFDKEAVAIIGDKNPGYSYVISHLKILLELFPGAKIIHLTRDYRDHYISMSKVDFEGNHLSLVCYRWQYSFTQVRKLMEYKPEQYYFLRYEELVQQPEKQVKAICNFLGIAYHASMLEYYKIKDKVLRVYPEELVMKYHSSLFQPISADFIGKWKHELSQKQVKMADAIVGEIADETGYKRLYFSTKWNYFFYILPDMIYSQLWLFYKKWYDKFFKQKEKKSGNGLMSKLYFSIFKR